MGELRNAKGQFVGGVRNDLTGQRFGRLVVIELDRITSRKTYWKCKCDCGNEKTIRGDCLGIVKSCGCLKREQDIKNLGILNNHNLTNHPVYSIWNAMINRCRNSNNSHYKDYGGRGIKVCEEWKSLENFAKWSEESGFKKGLSIERIDVNGNYCPENCAWIPFEKQAINKRNTVMFTIENVTKPLVEWAREYGISPKLAWQRHHNGYSDPSDIFYNGNLQLRDAKKVFGG